MNAFTKDFSKRLAPSTADRREAPVAAEVAERAPRLDDDELADAISLIAEGRPFLVHGQYLIADGAFYRGQIRALSFQKVDGQIRTRRWVLTVNLIHALLCEDALRFPWRTVNPRVA